MTRLRYLIAGCQRSGTSVTHYCLREHPNVASMREEITVHPLFTRGIAAFTGGGGAYEERVQAFSRLFDAMTSTDAHDGTAARGLKVAIPTPNQAADLGNGLRELLPDAKVVFVRRRDTVAQCGSLYRARQLKRWSAWTRGDAELDRDHVVTVPPDEFVEYALECRRIDAQLAMLRSTHDVCELVYETDIEPGMDYDKLFGFLGLPRVEPTWAVPVKIAPPARQYVANYDELCALLADLPEVTDDETRATARRRARAYATDEKPFFLVERARARLAAGRLDEARDDLFGALRPQGPVALELPLRGEACARLEQVRHRNGEDEEIDALLREVEDSCGGQTPFLFHRGRTRLHGKLVRGAADDLLACLQREPEPDVATAAADLLGEALAQLGDTAAAAYRRRLPRAHRNHPALRPRGA